MMALSLLAPLLVLGVLLILGAYESWLLGPSHIDPGNQRGTEGRGLPSAVRRDAARPALCAGKSLTHHHVSSARLEARGDRVGCALRTPGFGCARSATAVAAADARHAVARRLELAAHAFVPRR